MLGAIGIGGPSVSVQALKKIEEIFLEKGIDNRKEK